jgi:hypothetical protein
MNTSQRDWLLKTGPLSLELVMASYVVIRTWNLVFVMPEGADLWKSSNSLMTSRAFFSP